VGGSIGRRAFLKKIAEYSIAGAGALYGLSGCAKKPSEPVGQATPPGQPTGGAVTTKYASFRAGSPAPDADIVVATDKSPKELVSAALEAFGGMERFVHKGDHVVIKPNISFANVPKQGATTNPDALERVIELCQDAGAAKVTIVDHSIDSWQTAFEMSGATEVAKATGAELFAANGKEVAFRKVPKGKSKLLEKPKVIDKVLNCDCFINMPIAKQHNATRACFSMKNLLGIVWDRKFFHKTGLDQCIADLSSIIRPTLIVVDATRVIVKGGPKGGGGVDVAELKTLWVGVDPVAVDALGCDIIGPAAQKVGEEISLDTVEYIRMAAEMGLGQIDTSKLAIKRV